MQILEFFWQLLFLNLAGNISDLKVERLEGPPKAPGPQLLTIGFDGRLLQGAFQSPQNLLDERIPIGGIKDLVLSLWPLWAMWKSHQLVRFIVFFLDLGPLKIYEMEPQMAIYSTCRQSLSTTFTCCDFVA